MNEADFKNIFNLPFTEAERFFKDKLNIPTSAWDELSGAAHAKGFMSAGAYQADLLADLRKMVDKAIAGGMDIREFRKQFIPLVDRYGWQLKGGGPAWRSDLIWRTNIRSANAAGRWQQFEDANIHYLKYVHNDSVMHPRPKHVALNGKILPRTDPFWTVNYPPNGFGCRCRAVAAHEKEYNEGDNFRPEGWQDAPDKGWDYNVGLESKIRHEDMLGKKLATMQPDLAKGLLDHLKKGLAPGNDKKFAEWVDAIHANRTASGLIKTTGEMKAVWFVEPDVVEALIAAGGPELTTTLITAVDRELLHSEHLKDLATGTGRAPESIVSLEHIKALPRLVRESKAILFDTKDGGLIFVFNVDEPGKSGKWAVRVNLLDKRNRIVSNSVRSGGYVDTTELQGGRYKVLKGRL